MNIRKNRSYDRRISPDTEICLSTLDTTFHFQRTGLNCEYVFSPCAAASSSLSLHLRSGLKVWRAWSLCSLAVWADVSTTLRQTNSEMQHRWRGVHCSESSFTLMMQREKGCRSPCLHYRTLDEVSCRLPTRCSAFSIHGEGKGTLLAHLRVDFRLGTSVISAGCSVSRNNNKPAQSCHVLSRSPTGRFCCKILKTFCFVRTRRLFPQEKFHLHAVYTF